MARSSPIPIPTFQFVTMSKDPSLTLQNFLSRSNDIPVNSKWNILWENSETPWDRGLASPALVELLVDKQFPLVSPGKSGKALVPGCGRGYDVALFAGLTAEDQKIEKAVGLDVSPKALEEARKVHQNAGGHIEFILGNFFSETEDWATNGPYDVVYDYTVLYLPILWLMISFSAPCNLVSDHNGPSGWRKLLPQRQDFLSRFSIQLINQYSIVRTPKVDRRFYYLLRCIITVRKVVIDFRYDELLGVNFERIYFDRPGKSHEVGKTDRMSVWRRRQNEDENQ